MSQMAESAASQGSSQGSSPRLSPSVDRLNTDEQLTATGLAHAAYTDHPSYPRQREAVEATRAGVDVGPVRTAAEWIDAVVGRLDLERLGVLPQREQRLHGRLLIYGLARVDPSLHAVLSAYGLLEDLRASIDPDPEDLFVAAPYSGPESVDEPGQDPDDPDEPPAGLLASMGFVVRLRGLGEIPELGYGFLVTDQVAITSAKYRSEMPPIIQVIAVGNGASAQATHLTDRPSDTPADIDAFRLIESIPDIHPPRLGAATAGDRYLTVVESSPGTLVLSGGTIVSTTSEALELRPDPEMGLPDGLDGAPIVVEGYLVGVTVVGASGDVGAVPVTAELLVAWSPPPTDVSNVETGPNVEAPGGEFTARAVTILDIANGIRVACDQGDLHMEHLVAALAESEGGPLRAILTAADMTAATLDAFMARRGGVTWPERAPREPVSATPLPQLSVHVRAALDFATRVARANGQTLIDEIHLAFGALSVTSCSVIAALADADIARDQLQLSFPSRGEVAQLRPDTADGKDLLGLEREVGALAAVIAAKGVDPPLSVGLFGDWGSGKSFFMKQLQAAIDSFADEAKADPDGSMFCEHIVQLTFNAWHYMDVDLWANLAAEVFEQLALAIEAQTKEQTRTDGEPTQRERLLAAAIHTRDVIGEAERNRDAIRAELTESEAMKDTLNERRADLDRRLGARAILTEAVANALETDAVKEQLAAAAADLGITEARTVAGQVQSQIIELRGIAGWLRALVLRWRAGGARVWLVTAAIVALVGVAVPFVVTKVEASGAVRALLGLAGAVSSVTALLSPYLKKVHAVAKNVQSIRARAVQSQEAELRRQRSENEKRLTEAETVVQAKRAELDTIEKQLVMMRADVRMKDFINERSRSQDYSKYFGTVARARGDFFRLTKMLTEVRQELDDGFPRIDRIVLYIDDLDRCPEDKVVAVLQAVHLLLAMPLFVVVVGVDSRWLLHSLRQHSRLFQDGDNERAQLEDTTSDEERLHWQSTPLNYLEKIFQIPFAVRPMDSAGYQRMVDELAAPSPGRPSPKTAGAEPTPSGDRKAAQHADGGAGTDSAARPADANSTGGRSTTDVESSGGTSTAAEGGGDRAEAVQQAAAPAAAAAAPPPVTAPPAKFLNIEKWERSAMKRLFPLIPSPRSAKRFVNIYRLLRATLTDETFGPFAKEIGGDYEVALLLLAMVTGHPSPTTEIMRELLDEERASKDWWDFIDECKARHPGDGDPTRVEAGDDDHDANVGDRVGIEGVRRPFASRTEDERWAALWAALEGIRRHFADIGDLGRVEPWTKSVARYSFESSRVLLERGIDNAEPTRPAERTNASS